MKIEAQQEGKVRKVHMSLNAEDFQALVEGGSVYYEQRRTFSELELNVDLGDMTKEEIEKATTKPGKLTPERLQQALMRARWAGQFDVQKAVDELNGGK